MFLFNNMLFGTHEEMVALDKSLGRFAEKAGMSMEHAIGAVIHMVEIEGRPANMRSWQRGLSHRFAKPATLKQGP